MIAGDVISGGKAESTYPRRDQCDVLSLVPKRPGVHGTRHHPAEKGTGDVSGTALQADRGLCLLLTALSHRLDRPGSAYQCKSRVGFTTVRMLQTIEQEPFTVSRSLGRSPNPGLTTVPIQLHGI